MRIMLINGVAMEFNEDNGSTYKYNFVNGEKISTQRLAPSSEGGIAGMQRKIDQQVSVLTPYLKGFQTVFEAARAK